MNIVYHEDIKIVLSWLTSPLVVGGYVRDFILYRNTKDIDIVIDQPLDSWTPHIINHGLKIHRFEKYQSAHFMFNNFNLHISQMRKDIKCFGRQAEIQPTSNILEDAIRRDFTINAIYADINGNIQDPLDGLNDLNAQYIRFIGDPEIRIQEDVLRILRYFRFLSFFDKTPDEKILKIIENNMHKLKILSTERLSEEYIKILKEPFAYITLKLMNEIGIHKILFNKNLIFSNTQFETVIFLHNNNLKEYLAIPKHLRLS